MDLTFTTSAKSIILSVEGLKADGTPGSFASAPVFTVESGTATLNEVADENSKEIAVDNSSSNPVVVKVEANCDLKGGTRMVEAKLFLTVTPPTPSGPPIDEVVELKLSAQ